MSRLVETGSKFGHGAVDTVKHNPVPAVLFGVGLGWLIVDNLMLHSSEEAVEPSYTDESFSEASTGEITKADGGEHYHGYRQRMGHAAQAAKERAVEVEKRAELAAAQLRERAKHLREKAAHGAHSAQSGFSRMAEERPLTLGLTGMAVGAMIGLIAAGAFRRDGHLGERREHIRHRAGEIVHEARERVGRVMHRSRRVPRSPAEGEGAATESATAH